MMVTLALEVKSRKIGTLVDNCHICISSHFLAFSIGDVNYFFTNLQTSVIYNSAIIVDISLLYLANLLHLYDYIFPIYNFKFKENAVYFVQYFVNEYDRFVAKSVPLFSYQCCVCHQGLQFLN